MKLQHVPVEIPTGIDLYEQLPAWSAQHIEHIEDLLQQRYDRHFHSSMLTTLVVRLVPRALLTPFAAWLLKRRDEPQDA